MSTVIFLKQPNEGAEESLQVTDRPLDTKLDPTMDHYFATYSDPSSMPDISTSPKYDQQAGFQYKRKPRHSILTEQEMLNAALTPKERDYCAHYLVAFRKCKEESLFSAWFCSKARHDYLHCQLDDQLLRMKEYERERRLMRKERAAS